MLFKDPLPTDLITGEVLEVDSPADEAWAKGLKIAVGAADVSDCFHWLLLDGSICDYICWLPVAAGDVGVSSIKGEPVGAQKKTWPMQLSLGLSFSWATIFVQKCNLEKLSAATGSIPSQVLSKQKKWALG